MLIVENILGDDIGYVELIKAIGTDLDIVNAARVSFGKYQEELDSKDIKLIKYLWEHKHTSPFEHNSLTFRVRCPLFVARQWMRHRIASYNEISYRYVQAEPEFYVPGEWRLQHDSNRQASTDDTITESNGYNLHDLVVRHHEQTYRRYKKLLEVGVAREQARSILPLATYTEFYFTCNLRALLHFIDLRSHEGAQYEIRQYAEALKDLAKINFPETFKIVFGGNK
jgi:thymidylate synthase (FAD)